MEKTRTNLLILGLVVFLAAGTVYSVSLLQNYYRIPGEGVVVIPPVAQFAYSPITPTSGQAVQFTDQSYDPDGTVVAWSWDFGDGATSTEQNPMHIYASEGTYTVASTVTDNDGSTNSTQKSITVLTAPPPPPPTGATGVISRFTYSRASPEPGEVVQFTDASYILSGSISSWSWDFGDGETSTLQNPTHVYSANGFFTVTLTVTDSNEVSDSVQVGMEVKTAEYTIRKEAGVVKVINDVDQTVFSSSNPTEAIQYALDACGASSSATARKMTFVEDGVYDLQQPSGGWRKNPDGDIGVLWMWSSSAGPFSYVTFEGQSWNAHLKTSNRNPNALYFMAYSGNPCLEPRIANLQIDGGATSEHPTWNMQNGIQTLYTHDAIFETLWIHHMGRTGMYNTEFSYRNEIRNNLLENNYRYGCSYTSSHTGHVHHNIFRGNKAWGLNIDATYGPADNTVAEHNLFENQPILDVYVVGESGGIVHNAFVRNNIFLSSASHGVIKTTFAQGNIVIENNIIQYSGSSDRAILLTDDSDDIRIINNQIFVTGSSIYGAILFEGASNCLLQGNHIESVALCVNVGAGAGNSNANIENNTFVGPNGVAIGSGVNNTVIRGNDFTQITGTPIDDNGTGTIIEDNLGL